MTTTRLLLLSCGALLTACTAETFSPSSTYLVEVVTGPPVYAAPAETPPTIWLRIVDDAGSPVTGLPVTLTVRTGGGTVVASGASSGLEGRFALTWTYGDAPGAQTLEVYPQGGTPLFLHTEATGFWAEQVAVGHFTTCAIDLEHRAWCWGDGTRDGLSRGDSGIDLKPDWVPVRVSGGHEFHQISVGADFACALDANGNAWCWGADDVGQLGQGAPTSGRCFATIPCVNYPVSVTGGHQFTSLTATYQSMCGIVTSGEVWCWGANQFGEAGSGIIGGSPNWTPQRALASGPVVQLVGGHRAFCARLGTGAVECWGGNSNGELGDGSTAGRGTPAPIASAELFSRLFAGANGFCARRGDGATWCWGSGFYSGNAPTRRAELDAYSDMASDWLGSAYALDGRGRLTSFYQFNFRDVAGGVRLTSIGMQGESGCGLGMGGQVWCWGDNSEGETGNAYRFGWFDAWSTPPRPVGGWSPLP